MWVAPDEYRRLDLRVHEVLRDVPLYDVSIVDLPGGGPGRRIADIRVLDAGATPSRIVKALFGLRFFLGRLFGWDRVPTRPEDSMLSRLSERDRRESEITPGTHVDSFLVLYQFPRESLREIRNATVHGWICTALASPHGERLPSLLGDLRAPGLLAHTTVSDGDPAVSTNPLSGDASSNSTRVDRDIRRRDLRGDWTRCPRRSG